MSNPQNTINNKLVELETATSESIKTRKNFDYKIQKGISEKLGDAAKEYYEKYLRQTLGDEVEPTMNKTKGSRRNDHAITYKAMPMHHYNTLLTMAFSKGEQLYNEMRKKAIKKYGKRIRIENNRLEEIYEKAKEDNDEITKLSPVEYLFLSGQLSGGRNSSLLKSLKKGELDELKALTEKEELWTKALSELRNFHSHIFHEPGPVSFKNLYGDAYKPDKKLTESEWKEARDWFQKRFEDARIHKIKTLQKKLDTFNPDQDRKNKKEDIEKTLNAVTKYTFEYNGSVTREALLFIACMFLRKSDAEWFVKKWTGMKEMEGVKKSTSNFFTENAIKESKTQLRLDNDIFKFRQIIGILSAMPELNNEGMKPFYQFIKEHNDNITKEMEKIRDKNKKEEKALFIIPSRKSTSYTYWYMKYLDDNGLLADFKVAYYKEKIDREAWAQYIEDNFGGSMMNFKTALKTATGKEKKRLNALYKEAKKNFIFKKPSAMEYDNYCIKKLNAFVQYDLVENGITIPIQVSLSPDFLMKWVFVHLSDNEKGKQIIHTLQEYLKSYYTKCRNIEFDKNIMNLTPGQAFPSSLINVVPETQAGVDAMQIQKRIEEKLNELKRFDEVNHSKRAPWKFASKRKIDYIFAYVHLLYLDKAFDQKKSVDTIRHEGINDIEYQDIFEFIRFYGRYYDTAEFKKMFFEEKKTYFQPLLKAMKQLDTLEGLYNFAIGQYINYLETALTNIDSHKEKYWKIFKLKGKSLEENIRKHATLFAVNHAVPHELIPFGTDMAKYTEWSDNNKHKEWKSNFSFIRYSLEAKEGFSNTDYLMQEIMPLITFLKNEKGTIQSNQQMFNALMRNKTNELMLWEIAKSYWKKATGEDYVKQFNKLTKNTEKAVTRAYKETNPYYKIYQGELEITIVGDKERIYKMKIKPKKFDDEYQYYENEYIKRYIDIYLDPDKKQYHCAFEVINKQIKDILNKYLDDIFLLMNAEKYIVQQNFMKYAQLLSVSGSKRDRLPAYYIPFTQNKKLKSAMSKDLFDQLNHGSKFSNKDLEYYRNAVMHQVLYENKENYPPIRRALMEFCKKNKIL